MDVTLLELHLPNAEFNAPFAGRTGREADDAPVEPDAGDTPAVGLWPVAALLGFVGLALLARYLRRGAAGQTTLDELEPSDAT